MHPVSQPQGTKYEQFVPMINEDEIVTIAKNALSAEALRGVFNPSFELKPTRDQLAHLISRLAKECGIQKAKVVSKAIGEQLGDADMLRELISIEKAKIATLQSQGESSSHIEKYGIKDESARIEIAKLAASLNGRYVSESIQNYGITDQQALIEIAKIAAAQNGHGTSVYIKNYGIKDESARIEIAKIAAAAQDEGSISFFIRNYDIKSQKALIELAKISAAHDGYTTSEHIQYYGIEDEGALIEIAKIAVRGSSGSRYIENYGIKDKNALIEIAQIAAANPRSVLCSTIRKYGITDERVLIELAKTIAANNGFEISKNISSFGITDQQALIEIAKIAAAQNGFDTFRWIENYGIMDRDAELEIFMIALCECSDAINLMGRIIFCNSHLHMVDMVFIPEVFEDGVAEPEGEQVLYSLFAQVVVDAVDLVFAHVPFDMALQLLGGVQVMPERLFNDDARPALLVHGVDEMMLFKLLSDQRKGCRGSREVEDAVSLRPQLLVELFQFLRERIIAGIFIKIGAVVVEVLGKVAPHIVLNGLDTRILADRLAHLFAEFLIGLVAPRKADAGKVGGQLPFARQIVQGRKKLARSEVAGCSKDH